MNDRMLINTGDKLVISYRRNEDGTNDGSIGIERVPGHFSCVAKAPRYATDAEWKHNAELIVGAIAMEGWK